MKKLRIGILDFTGLTAKTPTASKTSIKEVNSLRDEIKKAGCLPRTYKVEKCQLYFHGRKSEILYNNKKIIGCDILIPRVSVVSNVDLEISIVKQFQMMDIPVLNEYLPIARAKNKLRTMQILTSKSIPVPRTVVVRKLDYIDEAINLIGGYPAILKTPFGSYGSGVVIVESRRSLYSALDIIWRSAGSNIILIQEYVAEADGSDYRAFVVGDRVVAAMQRTAKAGDFRSNLHLGGAASRVKLTEEEEKLAVRATEALGLQISGVDILRSANGPMIMEVNSNPGFTGLAGISKVNVAKAIVDYSIAFAKNVISTKEQ